MSYLEIIPNSDDVPQHVVEESNRLMKSLFGQSVLEMGQTISESIRIRRFNNQVEILGKVEALLKDLKTEMNAVPLKVLAPMIELSSYEEEESLQIKWSYLIANSLTKGSDVIFSQNCIKILNSISSQEALLLDKLHMSLVERQIASFEKNYKNDPERQAKRGIDNAEKLNPEWFAFGIIKFSKEWGYNKQDFEFMISNLVILGALKWETEVEIQGEKSSHDPEDKDLDLNVEVSNNDFFIFTLLGNKFVKVCKTITDSK